MKSKDLFRDIFGLAVRLLGLVFLYLGLSGVPPLLDFGALQTANPSDVITAILPLAFNLTVAGWLLSTRWLIRRAYPEANNVSARSTAPGEGTAPAAMSFPSPKAADWDAADKKLAVLVDKPKADRAGWAVFCFLKARGNFRKNGTVKGWSAEHRLGSLKSPPHCAETVLGAPALPEPAGAFSQISSKAARQVSGLIFTSTSMLRSVVPLQVQVMGGTSA
jgi:hypothetical protein